MKIINNLILAISNKLAKIFKKDTESAELKVGDRVMINIKDINATPYIKDMIRFDGNKGTILDFIYTTPLIVNVKVDNNIMNYYSFLATDLKKIV